MIKINYAKKIKNLREDNDITQEFISKKLKCTVSNYTYIETGKSMITLKDLVTLSNFYNISLDYLLGLSKNKNNNFVKLKYNGLTISKNIKNLRLERGLKQIDIASILNCSQSNYSRYENQDRKITVDVIFKICDFYKVSSYILFN